VCTVGAAGASVRGDGISLLTSGCQICTPGWIGTSVELESVQLEALPTRPRRTSGTLAALRVSDLGPIDHHYRRRPELRCTRGVEREMAARLEALRT
jgi:hypothetical protein